MRNTKECSDQILGARQLLRALLAVFFLMTSSALFANDDETAEDETSGKSLPSILFASHAKVIRYDARPNTIWSAFPPSAFPNWPIELNVRFKYYRSADARRFRVVAEGICNATLQVSSPYVLEANTETDCVHTALLSQGALAGAISVTFGKYVEVQPGGLLFPPLRNVWVYATDTAMPDALNVGSVCDAAFTSPVYLASIDSPYFDNLYSQRDRSLGALLSWLALDDAFLHAYRE
jgi:hypothetical protein